MKNPITMSKTEYAYSLNAEEYKGHFSSRDCALQEAIDDLLEDGAEGDLEVWTAVAVPMDIAEEGGWFSLEDVLERVHDNNPFYEDGEIFTFTKEQEAKYTEFMKEQLRAFFADNEIPVHAFTVKDEKHHVVKQPPAPEPTTKYNVKVGAKGHPDKTYTVEDSSKIAAQFKATFEFLEEQGLHGANATVKILETVELGVKNEDEK